LLNLQKKEIVKDADQDREHPRRRLREWFGAYYNDPDRADRVSVWGSTDQLVEGLQEVISAGVCLVISSPVHDMAEQMEILASEVIPSLTGTKSGSRSR